MENRTSSTAVYLPPKPHPFQGTHWLAYLGGLPDSPGDGSEHFPTEQPPDLLASNQFFCHLSEGCSPIPNALTHHLEPCPGRGCPLLQHREWFPTSLFTHTVWGTPDTSGRAGQASPAHIPNIFRQLETCLCCCQPSMQGWEETDGMEKLSQP